MSPSVELFGDLLHPELDNGRVFIDPTRFVADPEKARRFPELPYVTVRLGYVAGAHFNADVGLAHRSSRASGILSPGVSAGDAGASRACYPGFIKPVGLMAAHYPTHARTRCSTRYPYLRSSAFERRMLFQRSGERHLTPPDVPWFSLERASIVPQS